MDSEDAVRRVRLLEKSVHLMLEAVRSNVVTTTIVPAGSDRYIGVNYFSLPSDTLLGILAGLEQIMRADQRASPFLAMAQGAHAGRLLLAEYREDLKNAISELAGALQPFDDNGLTALLCDVTAPRSAATDTRAERRRFVTNACVYATFVRGIRLGVIDRIELEGLLGRELSQYKKELLGLFGKHGYIRHALDSGSEPAASSIALDFVNVHQGFWDLSDEGERALFAATTDLILGEPRFRIPGTSHFLVSADNPQNKMIHKIAAPAYQGRSCWPTFNVEFADRMLDYDECSGTDKYRSCARDDIAGHSYRDRNARRISGTAVGKRPEIPHVGLSGRRRAFLVSPFPDGLEEGIRGPAAGLELARSNHLELSGSSARGESGDASCAWRRPCSDRCAATRMLLRLTSMSPIAQIMSRLLAGKRRTESGLPQRRQSTN